MQEKRQNGEESSSRLRSIERSQLRRAQGRTVSGGRGTVKRSQEQAAGERTAGRERVKKTPPQIRRFQKSPGLLYAYRSCCAVFTYHCFFNCAS